MSKITFQGETGQRYEFEDPPHLFAGMINAALALMRDPATRDEAGERHLTLTALTIKAEQALEVYLEETDPENKRNIAANFNFFCLKIALAMRVFDNSVTNWTSKGKRARLVEEKVVPELRGLATRYDILRLTNLGQSQIITHR